MKRQVARQLRNNRGLTCVRVNARTGVLVTLYVSVLSGCGAKMVKGFDSPEPAARNVAIVQSVDVLMDDSSETTTLERLVSLLGSDDPATRLLAIAALERRTGERLGYDPTATNAERIAGIQAWMAWLIARQTSGGGRANAAYAPEAR